MCSTVLRDDQVEDIAVAVSGAADVLTEAVLQEHVGSATVKSLHVAGYVEVTSDDEWQVKQNELIGRSDSWLMKVAVTAPGGL